jgi:surface antigen
MRITSGATVVILPLVATCLATIANAAPPPHAKAHGWRAKHMGHTGYEWQMDYGVVSGRCDREAVATVIGGVTGAIIGNRVADPEDRTVATIVGALAGAFIGNRIGERLDRADQACVGHALELGQSGQPVSWTNGSTTYRMIPGADRERNGSTCREFTLRATAGPDQATQQGLACQSERGAWEIVQ